jgi:DNA polymerase III alpha subunit
MAALPLKALVARIGQDGQRLHLMACGAYDHLLMPEEAAADAVLVEHLELAGLADGQRARIAGAVIARQRPGTAKGFVFLSIEDETGIANAIVTPAVYEQFKHTVIYEKFLLIEGELQKQQGVISVKAHIIHPLEISAAEVRSHDFH